ncbi:YciI family protein [Streptomyces sp. NBC_01465]|uniref:YciI family protein n=1 Tax=Streptomyces sp. NBC_01465 TaxID=2903878 RepID=UPI002E35B588|nr:YciI family protein [Streptomyces sp. NBC_01465]
MGQYLILIYDNEQSREAAGNEAFQQRLKDHNTLHADRAESILGANALQEGATATSIRTDAGGEFTVTDGAFAETKEVLAGYYLIEAADLDEAITVAKEVPAPYGGVEVRPIRDFH